MGRRRIKVKQLNLPSKSTFMLIYLNQNLIGETKTVMLS